MKLTWDIAPSDVARVRQFISEHEGDPFVQNRIRRNLRVDKPGLTKSDVWGALVMCLLTTQQKSGPDGAVARFLRATPFSLAYERCRSKADLASFATAALSEFRGIRRSNIVGKQIAQNFTILEGGLWTEVMLQLDTLRAAATQSQEQAAARFLAGNLEGLGPKQSRNLLQALGLTRFEVPIDSRLTKWLNTFGFPVRLSASALSDPSYYDFVSGGVQQLCAAAGVIPCVLDAAVFSTADGGRWQPEDLESWGSQ